MRTVFTGGAVFDGTGAALGPADVVVEDGRIVDRRPRARRRRRRSTAPDGRSCPGFIDSHVHFMSDGNLDPMSSVVTPFSLNFYLAAERMARTLAAGVTTVREAGGSDLGVKEAQAKGLVAGPRMLISITILSQTGGHADRWQVCGAHLPGFMGITHPGKPGSVVDGPEEMRRKVRELIRAGADVIKVCTSGGVLSPRDDPRHGHFRDDELDVLVARGDGGGQVGDEPRPGDRRHQVGGARRRAIDRARHLPRRRGDRDDDRPRHVTSSRRSSRRWGCWRRPTGGSTSPSTRSRRRRW